MECIKCIKKKEKKDKKDKKPFEGIIIEKKVVVISFD